MTEEELKNKEKRKHEPLTKKESLTFFFIPFNGIANGLNYSEQKRFEKHGYQKKIEQMNHLQGLGRLFYVLLIFIIYVIRKKIL
ncbi:hypothetical protein [uncultured Dokdonia sp.]|uniref:hypothetical protein n=1 Tax=uncultured Dokdonia sp. TaxID=575653 RepID=UPI002615888B|nr:hypothetical protein [uncultured Dokdonia sp.]